MAFVNPQVYGNLPCATLGHERRGGAQPREGQEPEALCRGPAPWGLAPSGRADGEGTGALFGVLPTPGHSTALPGSVPRGRGGKGAPGLGGVATRRDGTRGTGWATGRGHCPRQHKAQAQALRHACTWAHAPPCTRAHTLGTHGRAVRALVPTAPLRAASPHLGVPGWWHGRLASPTAWHGQGGNLPWC